MGRREIYRPRSLKPEQNLESSWKISAVDLDREIGMLTWHFRGETRKLKDKIERDRRVRSLLYVATCLSRGYFGREIEG